MNAIDAGSMLTDPVRVHRTHLERVSSRGEVCVRDRSLSAQRAPIGIRGASRYWYCKRVAGAEAQTDEVDLQLVLTRCEIGEDSSRSPSAETICGTPLIDTPLISTGGATAGLVRRRRRAARCRSSCRTRAPRRDPGTPLETNPGASRRRW